jgi:hypothetical protein
MNAVSPNNRFREREAYLCQFPDSRCDRERVEGTGYCASHLYEMRGRRIAEMDRGVNAPEPAEFCCDEDATGVAA